MHFLKTGENRGMGGGGYHGETVNNRSWSSKTLAETAVFCSIIVVFVDRGFPRFLRKV